MGDPEPRDRETVGAGGPGPDATEADPGPNGSPDTLGTTLAGETDPGQATGGETLDHESSITATEIGDATRADRTGSPQTQRPAPTIAGYLIEGELGRGAMGVVYRARQIRLNRPCALKVILAGAHADPITKVRFLGEAEAVARLQHPNVVQIHHIGEADGLPFLELEYVPGGSLDRRLDGSPWPARRAATLVEALARGVAEAHRLGIIHRDLKPGNILIAVEGTPKIADFGLAKVLNVESGLTASESIMGTPSYMAPEQAEGKAKHVGPPADVHALGAILYELLVGRPPFRGTTVLETLEQVKTADPVPPIRLVPGVPRDAETIVLKCLQKDPSKRYPLAAALVEDLRRFLEDRPIRARRVSSAERLLRWGRRNKLVASLLASLVVTLVVGLVVSTSQWIRADRHAAREETLRVKETALREEIARELYTSDMVAIQRAWEDGAIGRMGELLGRHIPRTGQTDWRDFEWHVFWRRFQGARPLRTLTLGDHVGDLAATPNGQTVAFLFHDRANDKSQAILWDAATGREPRVFEGPPGKFANAVALSPDGKVFATGSRFDQSGRSGSFVNVWDAVTGEPRQSLGGRDRRRDDRNGQKQEGRIVAVSFSSDGKMLVSASSDNTITLWELETGLEIGTFSGHTAFVTGVALTPDGRRIASASYDNTVRIWEVGSGDALFTSPKLPGVPVNVAFSSGDGRYLAAGAFGPGARLWDVTHPRNPRRIELRGQPDTMAFGVSLSPDGRYLATSDSNRVRLWIVETGEAWATLRGHSSLVEAVAFLDGGRMLASASQDRTVKVWDVARAGAEPDVLTGPEGFVFSLAFTPDGKTLASSHTNSTIKLWEVESGRERPPLEVPGEGPPVSSGASSRASIQLAIHGRTLADNRAHLWDLETGRLLKGTLANRAASLPVCFSLDGAILATASSGTVSLWDVATRELRQSLVSRDSLIHALAFSPDGRILTTGGEDRILGFWDVATGRQIANLDDGSGGHTGIVESAAFSPNGRALVSGGWDGTAKVWDVADPARPSLRHTLKGHAGLVKAVAYSPDGRTIASGSADKTIKLWDPTTGRERCTLVGHTGRVLTLTFSSDGTILASGDTSGTIRLWRR